MLSSDADALRSLPERRAFTVVKGPLANTPPAPSSSSAFFHLPPSPASTRFFSLADSRLIFVVAAYLTLCERHALAN
eukprot:6189622-Pleurochrysis_carterae.AAC.1